MRKIEQAYTPPKLELNGMPYEEYVKPQKERSYPYNRLDGGYPINKDNVSFMQKLKWKLGIHDRVGYLDTDRQQFVRTSSIVCGKMADS
ncbi:hypothetical protein RE474_03280 [Methanolobus sediminis]|uniref:Uncharacterized protein n=1 Tax=Methanolobus sediminis TaxID=3072978 RepID=A0AA51ULW0_9EURY|nr:hypothetical protein [Methanolobus sediminis]WMW25755.1 hypothetical protein RE474_03280 [Methanolobus sediminis]